MIYKKMMDDKLTLNDDFRHILITLPKQVKDKFILVASINLSPVDSVFENAFH